MCEREKVSVEVGHRSVLGSMNEVEVEMKELDRKIRVG